MQTLDALADGQFQPKLGDPGDTLTKRGGKGAVVFEGREYSRLEWITRSAKLGHTLHAGEGALLVEELERVRALVESAGVPHTITVNGDERLYWPLPKDATLGEP